MAENDIRLERVGHVGLVTLDRPRALNALTHAMVRALSRALARWRDDDAVRAVVIRGEGERAFCAGGDVRAIYEAGRRGGAAATCPFYRDEYRMNWRIARFPKPYVALIDGIAMGGGLGVSVHGSHRVVTERAVLAMPETGIGFFPDIGATHFLSRCPGEIGVHLGLTGRRLGAADAIYTGLATHHVPAARIADLERALLEAELGVDASAAVDEVLAGFAADAGSPQLEREWADIERCFAAGGMAELQAGLERAGGAWAHDMLEELRGKSPLSLAVTLEQLRRGRGLDLESALRLEYRLVHRFMDGHDFYEGVRAALVDKDRSPRWRPARIDEVTQDMVARCFEALPGGDLDLDWNQEA